MVILLPDAKAICPSLATISPSFFTPGATKKAKPPSLTRISPWLITLALALAVSCLKLN